MPASPAAPPAAPPVSTDIGVLRAGWRYASISDKIADDGAARVRCRGYGWPAFLRHAGRHAGVPRRDRLAVRHRRRHLGHQHSGRLGLRDRQHASGGSASATPAPSSRRCCCCCASSWRTSINRFAEAMTLFAAGMAGLFPLLHLGRPWFFYWIAPYPDKMNLWPQWRSPLVWDFFAIATYIIVSLAVLVSRPDPRPGDAARPRAQPLQARSPMACSRSAGAARRATGRASSRPTCCWPGWRRRWSYRCTRWSRSISRSATRPATTRRSFRRISSPARCSRASRWC